MTRADESFDHIKAQVLANAPFLLPADPKSWRDGVPPEPDRLPIDGEIDQLIQNKKGARIRSSDEIGAEYPGLIWQGPYLQTRVVLFIYADMYL